MSTNVTKLKRAKQQIKAAKEVAKSLVKSVFREMATTEVFDKFPDLVGFFWRQYTPYFNDGDPCTFRCNTEYAGIIILVDGVETEIDQDWGESETPEQGKMCQAAQKFLSNFDEEDFEDMFGDHVKVIVRRDSIETEGYDHD